MLNGSIVAQATAKSAGAPTRLERILRERPDDRGGIEAIYLSTLSRIPRDAELARGLSYVRSHGSAGYGDVMEAQLNSNEFLLSHRRAV